MRLTSSELEQADQDWLVEVTLRGEVYRFATRSVTVVHGDTTLQFAGTLGPLSYSSEGQPWDAALSDRSIEVSAIFSSAGFSSIASTDHDIGDATCEVSLWRVGDDYAKREIIIAGFVDGPSYSNQFSPVTFSVRESALLDTGRTLAPLAVVSDATWPATLYAMDAAISGQPYPIPFGSPGALVGDMIGKMWAVHYGGPALLVQIHTSTGTNAAFDAVVLIGDGELSCVGLSVFLQNITQGTAANVTASLTQDALGRNCTVLNVDAATMAITVGDELWCSFRTANSGGVRNAAGGYTHGAGDILSWLLDRSGLRIDTGQVRGAAALLNGYRLDFVRNQDQGAWEAAQDVIRDLPASLILGPAGLRLVVWKLDATAADAIDHIDTSREMGELSGQVSRTSREDVANVLSIEYAVDARTDTAKLKTTFGPTQWIEPVTGYDPHPLCSASFTRYQGRDGQPIVAEVITSDLIQDPATAAAVLHAEAMRRCGTHTEATFSGLGQRWQYLNPGDVITVTHSDISWVSQVCLVTRVDRAPGLTSIGLLSPNHWIRDATG